jgi:predicted nucleic acid-binding protein
MNQTNSLFVDTSGWAAPIVRNAARSAELEAFSRTVINSGRTLITTNYIMAELIALLNIRTHQSRVQNLAFVNQVKRMAQIIHVDPATDADAWAMLEQYTDKEWSLVDAASFVVMRRLGITEAFTTDHHFAQAGFVRVPA